MNEIPNSEHEVLDFALLPLGDRIVAAVPLRRMPQEAVLDLLMAGPGGPAFLTAADLLMMALSPEDADHFAELDFGDAMTTIQAFMQTQIREGYPSMGLDLDAELKDLID